MSMLSRTDSLCFRLRRLQNILYFTAIALALKLVFFKSLKFRRIFFFLFRLLFSALSALTGKLGFARKTM